MVKHWTYQEWMQAGSQAPAFFVASSDYDALAAQLAEAKLSRDSWKREAEMNAECCDRLHVALQVLKDNGIHVEEKWCWCAPEVTDYSTTAKSGTSK